MDSWIFHKTYNRIFLPRIPEWAPPGSWWVSTAHWHQFDQTDKIEEKNWKFNPLSDWNLSEIIKWIWRMVERAIHQKHLDCWIQAMFVSADRPPDAYLMMELSWRVNNGPGHHSNDVGRWRLVASHIIDGGPLPNTGARATAGRVIFHRIHNV